MLVVGMLLLFVVDVVVCCLWYRVDVIGFAVVLFVLYWYFGWNGNVYDIVIVIVFRDLVFFDCIWVVDVVVCLLLVGLVWGV